MVGQRLGHGPGAAAALLRRQVAGLVHQVGQRGILVDLHAVGYGVAVLVAAVGPGQAGLQLRDFGTGHGLGEVEAVGGIVELVDEEARIDPRAVGLCAVKAAGAPPVGGVVEVGAGLPFGGLGHFCGRGLGDGGGLHELRHGLVAINLELHLRAGVVGLATGLHAEGGLEPADLGARQRRHDLRRQGAGRRRVGSTVMLAERVPLLLLSLAV